jgi:hypothetical protein
MMNSGSLVSDWAHAPFCGATATRNRATASLLIREAVIRDNFLDCRRWRRDIPCHEERATANDDDHNQQHEKFGKEPHGLGLYLTWAVRKALCYRRIMALIRQSMSLFRDL